VVIKSEHYKTCKSAYGFEIQVRNARRLPEKIVLLFLGRCAVEFSTLICTYMLLASLLSFPFIFFASDSALRLKRSINTR
jgi:hypothetical protein